ncbi:hypothetical protein [Amnibacterium endophyticum]|uniref:Uncharacterized protein n=1 Tax=Amnibacterium endophyticum TaxID=2109337 RepID=A0ABW4LJZ2_9MICO
MTATTIGDLTMSTSASSSTPPGTAGGTTAAILSLGERIAATIDGDDVLARWMAHYLAERLHGLPELEGAVRAAAEAEVAGLVLQFWQQRAQGFFGGNPVAALDAIERTLKRLDPQRPPWAFHGGFRGGRPPEEDDLEVAPLLRCAEGIDRLSGDVVRELLVAAAAEAVGAEAPWVTAVLAAGVPGPDRWLQRLLDGEEPWDPQSEQSLERLAEDADRLAGLLRQLGVLLRPSGAARSRGEGRDGVRGLVRGAGDGPRPARDRARSGVARVSRSIRERAQRRPEDR